MAFDTNNPYFRTKVLTASPEELRLMLLDGALHFVSIGREGLAAKNYEKVYEGFSQSKAIVMELINALRPEHAPELCKRLAGLYTYIYRLLMEASFERADAKAQEAERLLAYERETWALLLERLAAERSGGASTGSAVTQPGSEDRAPLSLSA
jgi:flagellar protein FliS